MLWSDLMLTVVDALSAALSRDGVVVPVYLGGWADVPTIDCVHVIRGDSDYAKAAIDGGIDQVLYVENWVYVDPESVDQGEVNAARWLGYQRLGQQERVCLHALRELQRNAPDAAEIVLLDERVAPDGDVFVPSHASQLTVTVRLWDAELC